MSQLPPLFRPLAKYAVFDGRSNRAEFWMFIFVTYALNIAFLLLIISPGFAKGDYAHPDWDALVSSYMRNSPPLSLFGLAILLPTLGVFVRRLHDTGRTGWWLIMPYVVAIIAYIVFVFANGPELLQIMENITKAMPVPTDGTPPDPMVMLKLEMPLFKLMLPWVMIPSYAAQGLLLIFCALRGTPGPNRFGPPPAKG